jgi:hypothetical protein
VRGCWVLDLITGRARRAPHLLHGLAGRAGWWTRAMPGGETACQAGSAGRPLPRHSTYSAPT